MRKKPLFMETTEVSAEKTAGEVTALLVQSGARRLMTEYDDHQQISGLRFELDVKGKPWFCVLPARVDPIFKIINGRRQNYGQFSKSAMAQQDKEQAKRVAWRQLLRWAQAQLAMIETGMVEAGEVFLPYVEVEPGVTMFQKVICDTSRMIAAPLGPVTAEFVEFE